MSTKADKISHPNLIHDLYYSSKSTINYCAISLETGYLQLKNIFNDGFKENILKIKKFIEENYATIFFIISSLFTFEFAFWRFTISAILTFVFENKLQQPDSPIITTENLALNILGSLGLVSHMITYPLSNPFFYFAPILNGFSFSKTMYSFYRSHNPIN